VTLRLAKSALTSADLLARLAGQDAVVKTVTAIAASTQDAIKLAGRAGGTSSYVATLTPGTLTASRTITVPDLTGTMAVSGAAQTVTFGVGIIGTDPGGSELLRVGGGVKSGGSIICTGTGASAQASALFIDQQTSSGSRIMAFGPNASTAGEIELSCLSSNATVGSSPLLLKVDQIKVGVPMVIGTDPGGSELLRVGGDVRASAIGLGTSLTAGNGAIQLANHTTKAGGIALGTDCFLYRSAAGVIRTDDELSMTGGKYFYLRGDASTDGSVRISSQSSGTAQIEKRASGTWTAMESWA
jgi:hypothetical protein